MVIMIVLLIFHKMYPIGFGFWREPVRHASLLQSMNLYYFFIFMSIILF